MPRVPLVGGGLKETTFPVTVTERRTERAVHDRGRAAAVDGHRDGQSSNM